MEYQLGEESRPEQTCGVDWLHHDCQIFILVWILPWGWDLNSKLPIGNHFPACCPDCQQSSRKGVFHPCIFSTPPSPHLVCPLDPSGTIIHPLLQARKPGSHPRLRLLLPLTSRHLCLPTCPVNTGISHNLSSSLHLHSQWLALKFTSSLSGKGCFLTLAPGSPLLRSPECGQNQSRKSDHVTPLFGVSQ